MADMDDEGEAEALAIQIIPDTLGGAGGVTVTSNLTLEIKGVIFVCFSLVFGIKVNI